MIAPPRNQAFALVVTLLLIVLIAIFITATLSTVGVDTQATDANASAENARNLADTALQTVISQIQEATTKGPDVAWASQPGMIRCYNNQGQETLWYKLYSAAAMVQTAPAANALNQINADLPTGAWDAAGSPAYGLFTDLNSPVLSSDGSTLVYPIVDPAGAKFSGTATAIQGFDINQTTRPIGTNTAPMPLRWIYVLKDGSLVPGDAGGSPGTISVPGATSANPVVGRIAFWTDDDSAKLNINTAGDGTYFDSPRFDSAKPVTNPSTEAQRIADRQFAVTPPVAREFQRYIGHPAQTRLSPVIPGMAALDGVQRSRAASGLSPFLQWGGSQGGTTTFWDLQGKLEDPAILNAPQRATPYATVDEWIFSQNSISGKRSPNTYTDQNGASRNLVNRDELNRLKFLLTASSEAPEINLFGKPRIAMWPIHNDLLSNPNSPYTTRFDRMIAGAATLNTASSDPQTYFFTRADSTSPTADYTGLPRNKELFGYLRRLAGTDIPGFGGDFVAKYSQSGADQILTEIFDYIRSTNAGDAMLMSTTPAADHTYAKFRQETSSDGSKTIDVGRGQVTPIYLSDYGTKGFGRFFSISEVTVNFGFNNYVKNSSGVDDTTKPKMLPAIFLGLFSPSLGPPVLQPNLRIQFENGDLESLTFSVNGGPPQPLFDAPSSVAGRTVYSAATRAIRWHGGEWHPFFWGGAAGPRPLYAGKGSTTESLYSFRGRTVELATGDKISFSGGTLRAKIFWADQPGEGLPGNPDYLVQELSITLPSFTDLPIPTKSPTAEQNPYFYRLKEGIYGLSNTPRTPVASGDTTRSAVATLNGDLRLIAALHTVPATAFAAHPDPDATKKSVHSLRDAFPAGDFKGGSTGFSSTGQLVKGVTYGTGFLPVTGLVNDPAGPDATGDWDNGLGIIPDGPYINKPDEVGLQYYADTWTTNKDTYSYYMQGDQGAVTDARGYSSPNRTLASPVMFGSLPTGVPVGGNPAVPWRTLLFRPQQNHFGQTTEPRDSLLLDWFWMPVVEPYAISTTFATAGKVNMNYQIAPFTYITRATALIGTLGSEYVIAVPTADAGIYKRRDKSGQTLSYRFPLKTLENDGLTAAETTGTLRQFKERFDKGEIFRSAAEICGIYLVPQNESWSSDTAAETFWASHKLSGDNTRERPYNGLYSRLTTKSNTYTLHVRAQVLKPDPAATPGTWTENPKRIASDYRGSFVINRYLDREDPKIPDFASASGFSDSIESFYKYRVLETRRFQP